VFCYDFGVKYDFGGKFTRNVRKNSLKTFEIFSPAIMLTGSRSFFLIFYRFVALEGIVFLNGLI